MIPIPVRARLSAGTKSLLAVVRILTCILLTLSTCQAAELTPSLLFDPTKLVEVEVTLPEEDWKSLCRQMRDFRSAFTNPSEKPFSYFRGDVTVNGVKIPSVGIRKKGFIGSLDNQFPSLKIDFSEYVDQKPIPGLDTLTLNNNKQDLSALSQLLTYKMFNAAGVHAPRVAFARVTVNGEYLGVYSHVESVSKQFLEDRYGESDGRLYEGTISDFYPSALSNLELKLNRKSPDRKIINQLATMLASKEPLDLAELEKLVDLDEFMKFWAIESLLGFWDGYTNNQNNYWAYEKRDGRLVFMPWGADMVYSNNAMFFGMSNGFTVYSQSMLANRLYQTKGIPERFQQTVEMILRDVWNEQDLFATIDAAEELIGPHLHRRQANAKKEMANVKKFITTRPELALKQLKAGPARVAPEPRKPSYTVDIGELSIDFEADWSDEAPKSPIDGGTVALDLTLRNEKFDIEKAGTSIHTAPVIRFGGPVGGGPGGGFGGGQGGPNRERNEGASGSDKPAEQPARPVEIVIVATRKGENKKYSLSMRFDRDQLKSSNGKPLKINGSLSTGDERPAMFNPFPGSPLVGEISFSQVGLEKGEKTKGHIQARIVETKGGMFNQRGNQRGGRPGGPPGGGPRPGEAPPEKPKEE